MIELGERLTCVASFVPNGSKVCDVGSDHAYLPVYLIQNNQIPSAIAGEVVEGPFLSAKQTVRDYRMEDRIEVRFGDGLQILSKEDNKKNNVKRLKKDKGLIERTESSKTILTEDNKELLND